MQLLNYVILSAVEGSPGRVPLGCNYVIATYSNRRKERFRGIHSTSLYSARYDIFAQNHSWILNKYIIY